MVRVDSWKNSVHTEDARRSSARHSRTAVYLHRVHHETGGYGRRCRDESGRQTLHNLVSYVKEIQVFIQRGRGSLPVLNRGMT